MNDLTVSSNGLGAKAMTDEELLTAAVSEIAAIRSRMAEVERWVKEENDPMCLWCQHQAKDHRVKALSGGCKKCPCWATLNLLHALAALTPDERELILSLAPLIAMQATEQP